MPACPVSCRRRLLHRQLRSEQQGLREVPMAFSLAQVHCKAKAYVEALRKLPPSQYAAAPSGHYGRDYNTLRRLALELLPELDERLLGKYVTVRPVDGDCQTCEAQFVEIETYARQI